MEDKKMNKELILAIEALEKENGIDKEIMFDAIEKSLMDEYKAEFDKADNGRVVLDRRTGDFHIYSDRTVVEEEKFQSSLILRKESMYLVQKSHLQMQERLSRPVSLVMLLL